MTGCVVSSSLSPGHLLAPEGGTLCDYAKGERIFVQGDEGDAVFFIRRGLVKISALSPNGKGAVIAVLPDGVFCGETCLAEPQPVRNATATALVDSRITRWDRTAFLQLLQHDPEFAATVVSRLAARAGRMEEDLIDHILNSSEKRLARLLLLLAEVDQDGAAVKVSQEVLAEMVGTTRSRVCYFMNKFRRLGFISYSDQLIVHPSLRSVVDADVPHDGTHP
ncbi:cyclic nucleotide-binding domain-containing protein [Aurantimonas aggregata]|uniref:Cyclic nucleotide-binding domain-containing protein n=1 Tax=Aurantimonas aggregata TaxID=2047720 RepID=A0A6L9MIM9_9HYPH|nr:Crp/Fnr family transcriptional regulator [Aurantimonas aggregata]NDV87498.1 cyclic nucleotide-binding domain-containing protein [Aurantimonas aggregata]